MRVVRLVEEIGYFDLAYGRQGHMWVEKCRCEDCGEVGVCLCMDLSDGEYGEGGICEDCVKAAFARYGVRPPQK